MFVPLSIADGITREAPVTGLQPQGRVRCYKVFGQHDTYYREYLNNISFVWLFNRWKPWKAILVTFCQGVSRMRTGKCWSDQFLKIFSPFWCQDQSKTIQNLCWGTPYLYYTISINGKNILLLVNFYRSIFKILPCDFYVNTWKLWFRLLIRA